MLNKTFIFCKLTPETFNLVLQKPEKLPKTNFATRKTGLWQTRSALHNKIILVARLMNVENPFYDGNFQMSLPPSRFKECSGGIICRGSYPYLRSYQDSSVSASRPFTLAEPSCNVPTSQTFSLFEEARLTLFGMMVKSFNYCCLCLLYFFALIMELSSHRLMVFICQFVYRNLISSRFRPTV